MLLETCRYQHMPSDRTRRSALRSSGLVLLGILAGCVTGDTGTGRQPSPTSSTAPETSRQQSTHTTGPTLRTTGTYADTADGPNPYPDRPDTLDPETVREYVADFELARTKNVLHQPDLEELSVDSQALYDRPGQGGHYAIAACRGYANYADGAHADWGQLPALYFVAPRLTVRVEQLADRYFHCTDTFAADDPEENFAEVCEGGDATYRVYNLDPESHTVSVTVEFLGRVDSTTVSDSETQVALDRTYSMGPATGLQQESVTYRRGTYRLTAGLEGGPETTYRWDLRSKPTYEDPPVTVVVTPVGGITVRRPPFREL